MIFTKFLGLHDSQFNLVLEKANINPPSHIKIVPAGTFGLYIGKKVRVVKPSKVEIPKSCYKLLIPLFHDYDNNNLKYNWDHSAVVEVNLHAGTIIYYDCLLTNDVVLRKSRIYKRVFQTLFPALRQLLSRPNLIGRCHVFKYGCP